MYAIIKDSKGGYVVVEVITSTTYTHILKGGGQVMKTVCFLLDESIRCEQAAKAAMFSMYPYLPSVFLNLLSFKEWIEK